MSSSRNVSFNSSILFGCSFVAIIPVLNRLLLLNRFCEPYRRKYENILIHIQRIIFAVHMQTPQCSRIVFYPPCNRHQLSLINIVYFFFFFLFGQCILFPFLSLLIFFTFFFFFSFRFLSCFFFSVCFSPPFFSSHAYLASENFLFSSGVSAQLFLSSMQTVVRRRKIFDSARHVSNAFDP